MLDIALGAVLTIVSIWLLITVSQYPDFSKITYVGPDKIPMLMACVIFTGAVIILAKAVYRMVKNADGESGFEAEWRRARNAFSQLRDVRTLSLVLMILLMLGTACFFEQLGLELASPLFLLGAMLLCGERRLLRLLLVSVLGTVCFYIIFVALLKIPLPLRFL